MFRKLVEENPVRCVLMDCDAKSNGMRKIINMKLLQIDVLRQQL